MEKLLQEEMDIGDEEKINAERERKELNAKIKELEELLIKKDYDALIDKKKNNIMNKELEELKARMIQLENVLIINQTLVEKLNEKSQLIEDLEKWFKIKDDELNNEKRIHKEQSDELNNEKRIHKEQSENIEKEKERLQNELVIIKNNIKQLKCNLPTPQFEER